MDCNSIYCTRYEYNINLEDVVSSMVILWNTYSRIDKILDRINRYMFDIYWFSVKDELKTSPDALLTVLI